MDNLDNQNTQVKEDGQEDGAGTINITITDPQGDEVLFKIKRTAKMRRLFSAYCKRMSVDPDSMRFFHQGERINDDDTPDSLVLKDGAKIDAFVRQVAGAF
ncbi:Ubiquitin family protein [Trichomonas vaginalis G3]|uniref:Ubiquitin family protein n=1 Tax=Trichomonas vaginalis (strain ATCC PRA-98 / G3) TaxID=412133 RepID=A2DKF5_TRIV3|nr:small ubiquitin-related modifier [Trichomonas vaginalis G3]EAY19132.1 Ubiquitin family protein [Trichomonas vaginalis G3]KAI5490429.1 small ubiquitin-related modifier [Trichomonas vaginalis G3]|eukprot:XP_001580118.1 Ubiquitin family protein [Trichomonas vaginalis G3]